MTDTNVAQNSEIESFNFENENEEDSSEKLEKMQKLLQCHLKINELNRIIRNRI